MRSNYDPQLISRHGQPLAFTPTGFHTWYLRRLAKRCYHCHSYQTPDLLRWAGILSGLIILLSGALAPVGPARAQTTATTEEAMTESASEEAMTESASEEAASEEAMETPTSPVLAGLYADPHIAHFGDRYYIYPTTDGNRDWRSTYFTCWSSPDLVNWTKDAIILDLPTQVEWADERAWAPCIAARDGKYYFYFSASQSIGVAVADHPAGPYREPLGRPLVARGMYNCQVIDPMVFIDDDGAAYLYFGQGNCNVVRLNDDMISFDADAVKRITPEGFNEGAFVLKRQGRYYLMWSEHDTRDPRYSVAYGVADSPLGPFERAENNPVLKGAGLVRGAGHHSVVQVAGAEDEWVIAYHRFRIPGGDGYNREVCLSPMRFDPSGAILPVNVFEPAPAAAKGQ